MNVNDFVGALVCPCSQSFFLRVSDYPMPFQVHAFEGFLLSALNSWCSCAGDITPYAQAGIHMLNPCSQSNPTFEFQKKKSTRCVWLTVCSYMFLGNYMYIKGNHKNMQGGASPFPTHHPRHPPAPLACSCVFLWFSYMTLRKCRTFRQMSQMSKKHMFLFIWS